MVALNLYLTNYLDTIMIDGKEYPKYLPEPLFIDGSQLVYKR